MYGYKINQRFCLDIVVKLPAQFMLQLCLAVIVWSTRFLQIRKRASYPELETAVIPMEIQLA